MNGIVRRKLDMAARVREFARANAATEPGYTPVLTRLDQLLTQAEAILKREREGDLAARGAIAKRNELRDTIHAQLVHYLVAIGSVAAKGQADVAARFKLPSTSDTNTAYVTAVKTLIAAGEEQNDLLTKAGLVPTMLEQLTQEVANFEAAIEASRVGRRDHIGARADLKVITAALTDQVKLLDGMTRFRFWKDLEMMTEWRAARAVLRRPHNGDAPPAPQPSPTPADVQQAA